ncbi:hypothetical protein HK100_000515 [Physocladia obscura]|uniref:Uncharacterized protein n=1 Tax=Physocladia obscura TaxID=109957 RepID=A0AAD5SYG1_9FUNG|nr:hypothetical protein HK100_000515 [Physocladia obscura]
MTSPQKQQPLRSWLLDPPTLEHSHSYAFIEDSLLFSAPFSLGVSVGEQLSASASVSRPETTKGSGFGTIPVRRARAETFSAFSTALLSPPTPPPTTASSAMPTLPTPIGGNRARAGSLTLPKPQSQLPPLGLSAVHHSNSSPFIPSFDTPISLGSFSSSRPGPLPSSKLKSSFYGAESSSSDTSAVMRSLDYLNLDDDIIHSQSSRSSTNPMGIPAAQSPPSQTSAPPQITPPSAVIGNRLRAMSSVASSSTNSGRPIIPTASALLDHFSFSSNITVSNLVAPASGNRPRASTIGIVDRFVVDGIDLYGLHQQSLDFQAQQSKQASSLLSYYPLTASETQDDYNLRKFTPSPPLNQQQQLQQLQQQQQQQQQLLLQQQQQLQLQQLQQQQSSLDYNNNSNNPSHPDFQTPTRSLWVGNLDATITATEILNLFSPYGPIESLRILPDKECVFVNYARLADALSAKEGMTGRKLGASVSPIRLGFGRNEAVGDTQGMQPTRSVWIGNLPPALVTAPVELENLFERFGQVESCRVLATKSCGFVNFVELAHAMRAQEFMNGRELYGHVVKVGFAKVPATGSNGEQQQPNDRNESIFSTKVGQMGFQNAQHLQYLQSPESDLFSSDSLQNGTNDSVFDGYASSLIPLPESLGHRRLDQSRLREMRKRLENPNTDIEQVFDIFNECYDEAIELSTDYIGNVVLQKLIERSDENRRCILIERLSNNLASLGVHKNGTWVVQKIIDSAQTTTEATIIVKALRPYTACLLLDQFGNYVIQCCLRLAPHGGSGFIFDALSHPDKCIEIATGRFGSRAMRSCLESQYTTKHQQKQVASAIVACAMQLVGNVNGSVVITWLIDGSMLAGRFRVLASKFVKEDVPALCRHKLASLTVLKIVTQRIELDARDLLLNEIFYQDNNDANGTNDAQMAGPAGSNLREIISDHSVGVALIQKILSTGCVSNEERARLTERVRICMAAMIEVKTNPMAYKRLFEEVTMMTGGTRDSLSSSTAAANGFSNHQHETVSTLLVSPPNNMGLTLKPAAPYEDGGNGYVGYGIPQHYLSSPPSSLPSPPQQFQQQRLYTAQQQQQQQQFYGGYTVSSLVQQQQHLQQQQFYNY